MHLHSTQYIFINYKTKIQINITYQEVVQHNQIPLYFMNITNLSFWNNPGNGEETVNGLFKMASLIILFELFKAQVNPYEPTRNPYNCTIKEHILSDNMIKTYLHISVVSRVC